MRAVTLDHGTPVLAFAFEQPRQFHIRKERLAARSLAVGRWLSELKSSLARGEFEAPIQLPDGSVEATGVLGHALVLITLGEKLAYATDLADTAENRRRLTPWPEARTPSFAKRALSRPTEHKRNEPGI